MSGVGLRTVHVLDSLAGDRGGPPRSVVGLCEALGAAGQDVRLVSFGAGSSALVDWDPDLVTVDFVERRRCGWSSGRALGRRVTELVADGEILHSHGLWSIGNRVAGRIARKTGTPHVISVRGMLDPFSFGQKAWKKKLGMVAFARKNLETAACIHVTAPLEAENVAALIPNRPMAVIPNGVQVPELREPDTGAAERWIEETCPEAKGKRIALFLGRIHPQKGLADLLRAWARVGRIRGDWHLVIVGPEQLNHSRELKRLAETLGMEGEIHFSGPLDGEEKGQAYAAAELFVLPSPSENFGIVVAEALAAGTPAIATTGTPWSWLKTHDCGWQVSPGPEGLCAALQEALSLTPEELGMKGRHGRDLVCEQFAWDKIAQQMSQVYEWILGRGEKPSCVRE
ncbi:MAG: glycosyltransferase [Planctomycetota bacterium]